MYVLVRLDIDPTWHNHQRRPPILSNTSLHHDVLLLLSPWDEVLRQVFMFAV